MKTILLTAFAFISLNLYAQKAEDAIKFSTTKYSFGKIPQHVPITYSFTFINKGKERIIIEDATADCGCTKPQIPMQPILPGKTGAVKVTYNAETLGTFNKKVYVKLIGYEERITLTITGEVIEKKKQ